MPVFPAFRRAAVVSLSLWLPVFLNSCSGVAGTVPRVRYKEFTGGVAVEIKVSGLSCTSLTGLKCVTLGKDVTVAFFPDVDLPPEPGRWSPVHLLPRARPIYISRSHYGGAVQGGMALNGLSVGVESQSLTMFPVQESRVLRISKSGPNLDDHNFELK